MNIPCPTGKDKENKCNVFEKCSLYIFFFFSSTTYITSCGNWSTNIL